MSRSLAPTQQQGFMALWSKYRGGGSVRTADVLSDLEALANELNIVVPSLTSGLDDLQLRSGVVPNARVLAALQEMHDDAIDHPLAVHAA